jgi:dolichyl-phosphate-mannose--protein O-mannosyl transferase
MSRTDCVIDGEGQSKDQIVHKEPKSINFFKKFIELQILMLQHNAGLTASHPYASGPFNWPFLVSGISFWTQNEGQKQIYLIGNIAGWWTCVIGVSVFIGILGADLLARRRGVDPIPECTLLPVLILLSVLKSFFSCSQPFVELDWILPTCMGCPLPSFLPDGAPALLASLPAFTPRFCSCRRFHFLLHSK